MLRRWRKKVVVGIKKQVVSFNDLMVEVDDQPRRQP